MGKKKLFLFSHCFHNVYCLGMECIGLRDNSNTTNPWCLSSTICKSNKFILFQALNPLRHTTILQQMTLNIFCPKMENLYNWIDNLWLKVENIVTKEENARFEQFLLLSLCFQKSVRLWGERIFFSLEPLGDLKTFHPHRVLCVPELYLLLYNLIPFISFLNQLN